jgi:hypothetical protein
MADAADSKAASVATAANPVDLALSRAIDAAVEAQRWEVVTELARALAARSAGTL